MTTFSDELKTALSQTDPLAKRNLLRVAVNPILKGIESAKLVDALNNNHRFTSGQINTRPTYSGIRDSLTQDALVAIAAGMQSDDDTLRGIADEPFGQFGLGIDPVTVADAINANLGGGAGAAASSSQQTTGVQMTSNSVDVSTIDKSTLDILDTVLAAKGAPTFTKIRDHVISLEKQLANRPTGVSISYANTGPVSAPTSSGFPTGTMKVVRANTVFAVGPASAQFDFDVPFFDWSGPHPMVPLIDPDYQFDPTVLLRTLWGLISGQKLWLHGETGTGKTTLIEQIAGRLGWPVARTNFDSEITRMDLIGRDTLVQENGATVTKFVDGILPQAMQMPCIFIADELDFIRSDVSYVFQRALENKGLLITEDGGRLVHPHHMFRIVATANTRGQGDDTGRYMGARPQSAALLDRFTCWVKVNYMPPSSLYKLLKAKLPSIKDQQLNRMVKYAQEHWHGFSNREILQPLSPRGLVSAGEAYTFLSGLLPDAEAMKEAIATTIAERANDTDAQTIAGIVQRVFK